MHLFARALISVRQLVKRAHVVKKIPRDDATPIGIMLECDDASFPLMLSLD